MISVNNLRKSFQGLEVLKGISTEIRKGDVVCIIGPFGSDFHKLHTHLKSPNSPAMISSRIRICLFWGPSSK